MHVVSLKQTIETTLNRSCTLQNIQLLQLELETLIASSLQINRLDIYLNKSNELTDIQKKEIENKISRLLNGEPLSYIIGHTQFRNITLKTGRGVLIPRPETEQIIDIAAKYIDDNSLVIDVGTGTGAIALSIAQENPNVQVIGVDISSDAMNYAIENKEINNIKNVVFKINDLCSGYPSDFFDLIIGNLPYISNEEYSQLPLSVSVFEPKLALTPGETGLELIERLVVQSETILKSGGAIILEIGHTQGIQVKEILKNTRIFTKLEILTDYKNLDRFVIGEKK